jgi:hypothetical protein
MKKLMYAVLTIMLLWSCKEKEISTVEIFNATCIKAGKDPEIINIDLKSKTTSSFSIGCHVFASKFFDPKTNGFGYVSCDSILYLVDPETGNTLAEFQLPGRLSQTVIDTDENTLIGWYNDRNGSYIMKIDLSNGDIKAKNSIDFGKGIYSCTHFYDMQTKKYALQSTDSSLIFINPDNGSISKSVKAEAVLNNVVFDAKNKRLIGFTYSRETDQNYIETLNIESGKVLSRMQINERHDYYACASDYDPETNTFILVTPKNKILFIDVDSGIIKDSLTTDFRISEFKVWRSMIDRK